MSLTEINNTITEWEETKASTPGQVRETEALITGNFWEIKALTVGNFCETKASTVWIDGGGESKASTYVFNVAHGETEEDSKVATPLRYLWKRETPTNNGT